MKTRHTAPGTASKIILFLCLVRVTMKAFIVSVTGRSKDLFSIMEYGNILKTVLTEKNGHLILGSGPGCRKPS